MTFSLFLSGFLSAQKIEFTPEEQMWIKDHPVVHFGYEPRWEPYEIYEDGEYGGIVGEYVKIIEEETGIDMRPIPNLTWDESMQGLISGTINVVPSCAVTPQREKLFHFTDIYIKDPIVVLTNPEGTYIGNISDLKGKTVALSKNYYTIELVREAFPEIRIIEKKSIAECLESVRRGESEAFIGNLHVITYYTNHKGFEDLKIACPTPFKNTGIALAVNPEFIVFRDIAQKVLSNIPHSRKHAIRSSFIAQSSDGVFFSTNFTIWAVIIAVAVIIIAGILYYWNKVLRGILKRKKITEQQLKESLVALKKQDAEKKVLLQEIHHRVKNNLQVVSSMIRLQANVNQDPNAVKTLNEAVDRVKTIALIHDKIYKSSEISTINLEEYVRSLYEDIESQYSHEKRIHFRVETGDIRVPVDTIVPLALILNELITNSFKYAFKNTQSPRIEIHFSALSPRGLKMDYHDNGLWFENTESDYFGTSLIEIFTDQLEGDFELNKGEEGTAYSFHFNAVKTEK
ncbi:MAG: transporter substrate-binding domain-containing protein [Brumimicrobium sp.]|nr:transporter substrate-binding domain-containing protein [Brumimicrobium sp.]